MALAASSNPVLYVTYIEKQGAFIKIWGQPDRNSPVIIKKSLLQLTPQFDQGICIPTFENLHIGNVLYCAKYIDNAYYRVRIINILIQQNLVEVHFVDFGNREFVSIADLRMVPSIAPGLVTTGPQAKDFILANVTHHSSAWDASTLSLISNEIRFSELTYSVVSNVGNIVLIKLYRKVVEDFALSLFNRGIVLSIALTAQHMILQNTASSGSAITSPTVPHAALFEHRTSPTPPVSTRAVTPVLAQPPTPALLTYKGAVIEPGSEYRVYVSYVCDGPCQFSVQLQKSEDNLARLMKELNTMTLQPLDDFPMPGTVCVARCVEDDHICRAVVTNMVDSSYKVFYVDFGNTEVVPIDNLFQIPFKYIIPKVMATRYALAGLDKSSVTLEMKCAFKEFVCDKLLRMQALAAPARSALPLCNLFDENNVNVLDVLQRVALLAYPDVVQLARGFSQEVHVSYVHGCSRFYVQTKGKEQELANLMISLQQICANAPSLQTVKVGLPCCALFQDDGQWYRAQVIQIEGATNVRVRYVDFGNEAVVTHEALVKPPGEIVTALRPQAIECCLNGYQKMEDDLERDNILEQIILENDFTMKVIEMQSNRVLVDLIDSSRYNVGSLLLEQLAASKSQVSPILIQENHQIEQRKTRSIDESSNFTRNERKPLRDQNERGFDRQDSWRQHKPPSRNEDDFDKPRRDNIQKSWRESSDRPKTDNYDKPKGNFDRPPRDNFQKRDGFKKDTWGDDESNSNWKSDQKDGFKKDNFQDDKNANWKSNHRDDSKKAGWDDNNSSKSNRDDSGWDNSEKRGQNNRLNKFDDNRKPRDRKPFSGNKQESWGSSDTTATSTTQKRLTDPAPFTSIFLSPDVLNHNEKIVISWFHDPAHFFCQLFDTQTEFKMMMEDIQNHYCDIKPETAPVGSSVIALFPNDGVMYRARVLEVNGSQYRVQYIDFGNVSTSDKVWPVENKFMKLPAQAICCSLNTIIPIGETWPDATSYSSYFDKDYYYCQFVSYENDTYAVELTSDDIISVSDALINANLAQYIAVPEVYDPSILLGQQIKVTVRDVQALDAISLELPNGTLLYCSMHNLVDATETFEDILKQLIDNFVLMYVDNVLEDKVEVTLYDTSGAKLKILEPDEGAFEIVETPCPLPILYSSLNGWVSHFELLEGDASTVYIQPAEHADTLAGLLESLYNQYEGALCEDHVEPEVNGIYAVHSSDTNWYRGTVKSIEGESVVVSFIDYGNSETVLKAELRNLTVELLQQHLLTIPVSVAGTDESFIEQNVTGTIWYGENGWEAEITIQPAEGEADVIVEEEIIESEQQETLVEQPKAEEQQTQVPISNEVGHEVAQQLGVSVVVSHTDSPSEFYLQQSDSLETIDNLQATLQEQVVEFQNLENPAAGILCAAPYSLDQQWYRAQILDADDDITTVRFVDYGNTDVISNDTTSVKTLPSELLSLEQYARRCSLMVEPNGPEWSSAAFERFEQLTNVVNLTSEIIHQDEKTTFVQLYSNGVDVTEVLVQEGIANKLQLEVESSCTGYVSNLNSPSEFWIQLENSVADLEWIAEQLSNANNFPELEDLTPGSLCAALFPDDEMWYRARILSNTVAGLEVLFIDYGNSCTCISLRQLPEELIMLAPLAQKYSLQKPPGILQWGQQANDEFKLISADGATVFNIDKVSTGETYIVRLLLNDEDISKRLLPITEDSYVSHFESINCFWIQKATDTSKLDSISETLTGAYDWPQYAENQNDCEYVAALCTDDETWYRARIVTKTDCDFEVFFIDYGNVGRANDIRLLNCDLDKEPPLAMKCRLEPLPGYRWGDESSTILAEINKEGSTMFQVELVGGDVVRLYLNGSDIRSKLECITVSSTQSSPKKSISEKPNETVQPEEEFITESTSVAECMYVQEDEIEPIQQTDILEEQSKSREIAESILSEIVDKESFIALGTENLEEDIIKPMQNGENTEILEQNHLTEVAKIEESSTIKQISASDCSEAQDISVVTNGVSGENNASLLSEIESAVNNKISTNECSEEQGISDSEEQNITAVTNHNSTPNIDPSHLRNSTETKEKHDIEADDNYDNSEILINRCSSISPYSEKVVPGFYSYHNHFENHYETSEETLGYNSTETQLQLDIEELEPTQNIEHTFSNLRDVHKVVPDISTTTLVSDEGTHVFESQFSIPHEDKIVPGCLVGTVYIEEDDMSQNVDIYDDFEDDDEENLKLNEHFNYKLIEDIKPPHIFRDVPGVDVSTRCSLPYTEKIVPGSISRGDLSECVTDARDNILNSKYNNTAPSEQIATSVNEKVSDNAT